MGLRSGLASGAAAGADPLEGAGEPEAFGFGDTFPITSS